MGFRAEQDKGHEGHHGYARAPDGPAPAGTLIEVRPLAPDPGRQTDGPQQDERVQVLRGGQQTHQVHAGSGQQKAQNPLQVNGPRSGPGQQPVHARKDGHDQIWRSHAESDAGQHQSDDFRGLDQRPGQHAAQKGAAARRGQNGGQNAGNERLQTGMMGHPSGLSLEIDEGQVIDAEKAQGQGEDQGREGDDGRGLLENLPPDDARSRNDHGQHQKIEHDAQSEKEVVRAERPPLILGHAVRHGDEGAQFQCNDGQHAGHEIEHQSGQKSQHGCLGQGADFQLRGEIAGSEGPFGGRGVRLRCRGVRLGRDSRLGLGKSGPPLLIFGQGKLRFGGNVQSQRFLKGAAGRIRAEQGAELHGQVQRFAGSGGNRQVKKCPARVLLGHKSRLQRVRSGHGRRVKGFQLFCGVLAGDGRGKSRRAGSITIDVRTLGGGEKKYRQHRRRAGCSTERFQGKLGGRCLRQGADR